MTEEPLDTHQKLEYANFALSGWMRSQGIIPADGVMLAEWFVARMIVANIHNGQDLEEKLALNTRTIRGFIALIQTFKGNPV